MMMSPDPQQRDERSSKAEPESSLSARLGAESALGEYQQKIHDHPTDEEAKDAFARLVVGRGFNRPIPTTPVMTIHSAIVSGEGKVEEAEPAPTAATKSQGLTGFLRGIAERIRARK